MLGPTKSISKSAQTRKRKRQEKGQAITEYGAILAFVAILVALTFSFTGGALGPAISAAFSSIASNLNDMSDTAPAQVLKGIIVA